MKHLSIILSAIAATGLFADDAPAKPAAAAKQPSPEEAFSLACSNAWLRCTTDKNCIDYAADEDIKFTFTLAGVTNKVPEGAFMYKWTRTGDDGTQETGTEPLTGKPFTRTDKMAVPGFLRVKAEIVAKDGKPLMRPQGKTKSGISFTAGAGVDIAKIAPKPLPKDYTKRIRDLRRSAPPARFRKVERTETAINGLNGVKAYSVSVPMHDPKAPAITGYLTVPNAFTAESRTACRLRPVPVKEGAAQPVPAAKNIPADAVTFFMAFTQRDKAAVDEAYCSDTFLRTMRALQYLKSLPEWCGTELEVEGDGMSGLVSLWAAASGEGVTKMKLWVGVEACDFELFDPELAVREVPASCRVDIMHVGLANEPARLNAVAKLWNALKCEKCITWIQGGAGWGAPRYYNGRDCTKEALRPMSYRNMDAQQAKTAPSSGAPFKDLDFSLRDTIVIEAVLDYTKPTAVDIEKIATCKTYADKDLLPLTVFAAINEKKVKDKPWTKFLEKNLKPGASTLPFPVYLEGGMDLPPPPRIPWIYVSDNNGVLRYSGASMDEAEKTFRAICQKLPPCDPVFAYAKPELLADDVKKLQKAKTPGPKIYKAIDALGRKYQRTDPARAEEAAHLLIGMRQATERQIRDIKKAYVERAGLAYNRLLKLLAEWPELATESGVKWIKSNVAQNPEIEKLAKMEEELAMLRSQQPTKPSEIKKHDAAVEAFRKKLNRYTNSKNAAVQGEAMSMQTDLDTPLPDPQEQQAAQ